MPTRPFPSRRPAGRAALALCAALCAALGACATPTRFVTPFDAAEVDFDRMIDHLATVDVVVLGEMHDTPAVHAAHWRILRALHAHRPDLIVSMEMFERDVQQVLWQYLLGDVDESEFLAKARPWSSYQQSYRPVIEFARANRLEVLAANAPRSATRAVGERGLAALARSPDVARSVTTPEDDYWRAFRAEMQGHTGTGGDDADAKMWRYYEAQCLKDDTMAESITDRLQRAHADGRRPLVVHFCGHFHSDHRMGTVARVMGRMPELAVLTLGVEQVPAEHVGTTASAPSLADYVLQIPAATDSSRVERATPAPAPAPAPAALPAESARSAAGDGAGDGAVDPGDRPGLGFMPDYGAEVLGCAVGDVTPDGAADRAGIEAGDVIVRLADVEVVDVASYAEALRELRPGQRCTVTVRRGEATLELPVTVGSRGR